MIREFFIPLLLVALTAGVAFIHRYAARHRLPHAIAVLCYLIPAFGGGFLGWMFALNPGQTLAQAAVGDERTHELWSDWVRLWPTMLLSQAASCIGNLLCLLASLSRAQRRWLPVLGIGAVLSGLALFVVFAYAPRA